MKAVTKLALIVFVESKRLNPTFHVRGHVISGVRALSKLRPGRSDFLPMLWVYQRLVARREEYGTFYNYGAGCLANL